MRQDGWGVGFRGVGSTSRLCWGIEVEESACLVACVCCECCEELVYGVGMVDISEELSALGA